MKTDEYVEEAAREKLGLVKDNEIVFQEEKQPKIKGFDEIFFDIFVRL